ncbi:hypothetical protein Focb16_v009749 [Fusarium oxysporum f. sp. cubense]|uniref:Chromo domain-containing protein n=1 Tax=Fusarium oxysporum f. sp. cubense TaxID=61366 RepID=A0A559LW40_FUSOC|nr:hypothetical protein Focb16_v009749 [Fusarium oxysporum f. sp. cubense]
MAPLASAPDSWTITPSPMDGVRPNFLILKHKINLVSHQDGPFVALFIQWRKSKARWEGWVDERFVHERDEAKLPPTGRKLAEEMQKVSGTLVPCESFMLTAAEGVDRGLNIPSNTSDIPMTAL